MNVHKKSVITITNMQTNFPDAGRDKPAGHVGTYFPVSVLRAKLGFCDKKKNNNNLFSKEEKQAEFSVNKSGS